MIVTIALCVVTFLVGLALGWVIATGYLRRRRTGVIDLQGWHKRGRWIG